MLLKRITSFDLSLRKLISFQRPLPTTRSYKITIQSPVVDVWILFTASLKTEDDCRERKTILRKVDQICEQSYHYCIYYFSDREESIAARLLYFTRCSNHIRTVSSSSTLRIHVLPSTLLAETQHRQQKCRHNRCEKLSQ